MSMNNRRIIKKNNNVMMTVRIYYAIKFYNIDIVAQSATFNIHVLFADPILVPIQAQIT